MPERLGDAPIESAYREKMNELARRIDEYFNGGAKGSERRTGFVLIVFPFTEAKKALAGDTGRANYISNARRDEVVVMLKEQIKRFEGQPDMAGHS